MAQPAGVYFQYRADDAAATYSTATTTAGIADSSGNARPNAVPSTAALRPTLNTGGAGGHSYLTFDGVDDRLTTLNTTDPSMVAFGNAKAGLTLAGVVRVNTATLGGVQRMLALQAVGGSNGARIAVGISAAGNWMAFGRRLDADTEKQLTGTAATTGLHAVIVVQNYTTGTQVIYVDGVQVASATPFTTGTTSATNANAWTWGATNTPAQWFPGDFYELAGYDRALTATEVGDYWAALNTRYAIAAVPAPVSKTLRVLRAGVGTSGAATLRVLRAGVTTETSVQANAGAPVTVDSLEQVVLSAGASSGNPTAWAWTQVAGPAVALRPNGNVPRPEFTAPATDAGTTVRFSLAVTSGGVTSTNPSTVDVTVRPHIDWLWAGTAWLPELTDVEPAR